MQLLAPKIDQRTFADLLKQMRAMAPFYTPEWNALQEREPGVALLKIFLHLHEHVITRLNQVPGKNLVAFFDTLGFKLLPAQSSTVPVTFSLVEGAREDVLVPAGTQLAATAVKENRETQEVIFVTQNNLRVSAAVLAEVFSVNAGQDRVFQHTADFSAARPFKILEGENKQEHGLYLGHADLLNQKKPATIKVDFIIAAGASGGNELKFVWEYLDKDGHWVTLVNFSKEDDETILALDETNRFQKSGAMILKKEHTGEFKESEIFGKKSRWIRCRMTTPLSAGAPVELPVLNTIRLSVNPNAPFLPDLAFNNDVPLDVGEIKVKMLAKDFTLLFANDDANTRLPRTPKNGESPIDKHVVYLKISDPAHVLLENDVLEFDNLIDDPERRTIVAPIASVVLIPPDETIKKITLNTALKSDYHQKSEVRIVAAIRKNETSVWVESLEGIDLKTESVIFLASGSDAVALQDFEHIPADPQKKKKSRTKLTLAIKNDPPGLSRAFIEGEVVTILPPLKPFGEAPRLFDTFYIASDEAFSKKGAKVTLKIPHTEWKGCPSQPCSPPEHSPDPVLSWEYWNGNGWRGLRVADTTDRFFDDGEISFICPFDIVITKVNGEEKFWIRARIIDGDYGREVEIENVAGKAEAKKGIIHFPIIKELKITYEDVKREPQYTLSFNNLSYFDHTPESIDVDNVFSPFKLLPERNSGIFLGFNKPLLSGPLRLFFSLDEQPAEENTVKVQWFYWNGAGWAPLNVVDETEHLTKVGILEWLGSRDLQQSLQLGKALFWIKGSIVEGKHQEPVEIKRLLHNTTYAFQAALIENEIFGSSNAEPNQKFSLLKTPVITLQVWVREPEEPGAEELAALRDKKDEKVHEIKRDEITGEIKEILVRWSAVEDFDDSGPRSRHYTIDARSGAIQFGDGEQGMIPPAGVDNLRATYTFGGGKIGNVQPGAITGLKNAIPFVQAVANYLDADGGAETETLDHALERGPQQLKNRVRAVAAEDFESLATNISRKVARAKCLPNIDESGDLTPGWVTVLIVPDTKDDKPEPTRQLIKIVKEGLEKFGANTVAAPKHIHVRRPIYIEITVEVTVIPATIDAATTIESDLKDALKRYIHPLTGGPEKDGWEFGRTICFSEIFALAESTPEVDFIEDLVLLANGAKQKDDIKLDRYTLPFSGEHKINVKLPGGEEESEMLPKSECLETTATMA